MTEIQPHYRKKCGLIVVTNYSKDFVDDPASGAPKLHYLLTQPCLGHLHPRLFSLFQLLSEHLSLRVHIPLKALRCRECLINCLRELGRAGNGQHDLYNRWRVRKVEFCKLCDLNVFW